MSDIKEKLIGIPHIRYLNLDERNDRKEYMENQFNELGITDYLRVSANRYGPKNYDDWKDKLLFEKRNNQISYVSILVNQLQSIIDWYYSEISETCLILEDDLNFKLAAYWNFDWNYLMGRLPCNWDCVQLHIIGGSFIPMGLTRRSRNNHGATCYLVSRKYAEKLIKMHYDDGNFIFYDNYGYGPSWPIYHYQSPDFVPYEIGITYSFPVFITNSTFGSDCYGGRQNIMAKKSDLYTYNWWKKLSKNYTLDDIFLLDSSKKREMILPIEYNDYETGRAHGHNHNGE
jgi:hypothetical protein